MKTDVSNISATCLGLDYSAEDLHHRKTSNCVLMTRHPPFSPSLIPFHVVLATFLYGGGERPHLFRNNCCFRDIIFQ